MYYIYLNQSRFNFFNLFEIQIKTIENIQLIIEILYVDRPSSTFFGTTYTIFKCLIVSLTLSREYSRELSITLYEHVNCPALGGITLHAA